jgi:hypothetical protein
MSIEYSESPLSAALEASAASDCFNQQLLCVLSELDDQSLLLLQEGLLQPEVY